MCYQSTGNNSKTKVPSRSEKYQFAKIDKKKIDPKHETLWNLQVGLYQNKVRVSLRRVQASYTQDRLAWKWKIWIKRGKYIQKNCPSDARGSNSAAPSGNTSHVGEVQSHVKVLDPMPTGGRG